MKANNKNTKEKNRRLQLNWLQVTNNYETVKKMTTIMWNMLDLQGFMRLHLGITTQNYFINAYIQLWVNTVFFFTGNLYIIQLQLHESDNFLVQKQKLQITSSPGNKSLNLLIHTDHVICPCWILRQILRCQLQVDPQMLKIVKVGHVGFLCISSFFCWF